MDAHIQRKRSEDMDSVLCGFIPSRERSMDDGFVCEMRFPVAAQAFDATSLVVALAPALPRDSIGRARHRGLVPAVCPPRNCWVESWMDAHGRYAQTRAGSEPSSWGGEGGRLWSGLQIMRHRGREQNKRVKMH